MHKSRAALMNRFLTPELGQVCSNTFRVDRQANAPLPGLVTNLLAICAAESTYVDKWRQQRVIPEVMPALRRERTSRSISIGASTASEVFLFSSVPVF